MKKSKNMKLGELSKDELDRRDLESIKGGCKGVCGCRGTSDMTRNMQDFYHVYGEDGDCPLPIINGAGDGDREIIDNDDDSPIYP